jgi:hypothetical protein
MDRDEFEALRDLQRKRIVGDISFRKLSATRPLLVADDVRIENSFGVDLRMNLWYNPEVGTKTFNVYVLGLGPICRLDVDGPLHWPAGRSHKHALQGARCPDRNLPDGVQDRPELAGLNLRSLFAGFCSDAGIEHVGQLEAPDEAN